MRRFNVCAPPPGAARDRDRLRRWLVVLAFAAAMAWMEAATVGYLRMLVGRVEPYQPDPLPLLGRLYGVEMVREAATLALLAGAGWLAGRNLRTRFAYFALAFGVWDLLYYAFLVPITGWPHSLLDWDVLFLLPFPWWAPVLAPVSAAVAFIAGGSLVVLGDRPERPVWPGRTAWILGWGGTALGLFVFLQPALGSLAGGGMGALHAVLPSRFDWPLWWIAIVAILTPVGDIIRRLRCEPAAVDATVGCGLRPRLGCAHGKDSLEAIAGRDGDTTLQTAPPYPSHSRSSSNSNSNSDLAQGSRTRRRVRVRVRVGSFSASEGTA